MAEYRVIIYNRNGGREYDFQVEAPTRQEAVDLGRARAGRQRGKAIPQTWKTLTQGPFLWDDSDTFDVGQ